MSYGWNIKQSVKQNMRVQRFGMWIAAQAAKGPLPASSKNLFTVLALSLALGLIALGQAVAAEDPYAGVRDKLEACFTCHGPNGASKNPQIPILAGQHMYYTYLQLKDFQAGRRISPMMTEILTGLTAEEMLARGFRAGRPDAPVMTEVATFLSKEEMRAIANFFSEQAWPNIGYREDPDKAKAGQVATIFGQCVQCHRGGYEGNSGTPRLAGQYRAYLEKTMLDFKSKARANSPDKSALLKTYSAEDIAGMAEFLAGM